MIYLLWTLLNIGLFLFFIVICFRATKLIRDKFGLLSFVSNSGDRDDLIEKENPQLKKWAFKASDKIEQNTSTYTHLTIDKSLVSYIDLGVSFGQEKSTKDIVPIEANSNLLGLVGGHKWQTKTISLDKSSIANVWIYTVLGSLKWKLLGSTIYSQNKTLTGRIVNR